MVSEGRRPDLGAQQASWAPVGKANTLLSSPAPLVPEGPSHVPLLISPAFLPGSLEGALEGRGLAWELSRLPRPSGLGDRSLSAPLLLLLEGPACLPLLISSGSGAWILSGLHFSSPSVPPRPTCSLGRFSHLLGCQGLPPVAGRHPSCAETLTHCLPTPPS